MTSRFFLLIITIFASLPAHAWIEDRLGAGFGVGMLYGHDGGIKLDYRINKHLAVSLGQGEHTPSLGLQWYLREPSQRWQPRVGFHHGVIDTMYTETPDGADGYSHRRNETFRDFFLELGNHISFGRKKNHAIEFAFTYALGDGGKAQRRKELGYSERAWFESLNKTVQTFNLGYRYNF